MPRPTPGVSWRRCKVTKIKGTFQRYTYYRLTFPKDFAESDEVIEGTFIYNPFEKKILFRRQMED